MLVHAMIQPYAPEKYRDEYEEKLVSAIQRKIEGREIIAAAEPQGNVINLMEALGGASPSSSLSWRGVH